MRPAQRRQVREVSRSGFNPLLSQMVQGALQVDGVPQDDGGNQQIEAARPIALVFVGTVPDFPESVEEHGPSQRVLLLDLVEPDLAATAQFGVMQPVEREERAPIGCFGLSGRKAAD